MIAKVVQALAFLLTLSFASPSWATVIYSQTFESFADGDDCTPLVTGDITFCRGTGTVGANTNLMTVENAVPGSGAPLPSGTKVLRSYVNAVDAQGDAGILIGDPDSAGYDNWIPAVSWIQFAMYINNGGGEVSSTSDRPMKLVYPCRVSFPCQTNYFLLETVRNSSHAPFCDTSLSATTDGNMWLVMRDSGLHVGQGDLSYPSSCTGVTDALGQTDLSERLQPGRWNIVRVKADFSDDTSAKFDVWLGAKGAALTHVMSWHGGTAVEGQSFTWTVPSISGHRAMWMSSTQPANDAFPEALYTYYDDIYIATAEGDLPNYSEGGSAGRMSPWLFRR